MNLLISGTAAERAGKMNTIESILKLTNQIINDWHADAANILKEEPAGLRLARAIKDNANRGLQTQAAKWLGNAQLTLGT